MSCSYATLHVDKSTFQSIAYGGKIYETPLAENVRHCNGDNGFKHGNENLL